MKVTDSLVHCLENEGVEYVFGIVGTETLDLADSLSKSTQIQYVNVRHEQGAAFMADVYGRLSKKVGVCLSTLGPGATNLLTGIASAQLDHSPVVALIGQAGVERHHNESHQYIDIAKLFEPTTKWSTQIKESQTVPAIIRKAFRVAKMEKPGSVAITIPENFSAQMIPGKPFPVTSLPESVPVNEALVAATQLIKKQLKPFIIIGNGVIRQEAYPELLTFINTIQSPVSHSFMAKGVLPKEHPLNFFTFGFNENDEVLPGMEEADLLIVIGFDFVEKLPKDWNQKKLPVLHIDTLPAEINEYYPIGGELVGNIKMTLQMLNQSDLPTKSWVPSGGLREQIKTVYQIDQGQPDPSTLPYTIENVLHCIESLTSENTIVISDVGSHKVSIARTYQPKIPNQLIISNGLASMGIAIPGAIGAKLACPDDDVICITGDGGALMNFAELETAKRLGLSFLIIVLNDSMLKLEVQQMNKMFGENYGVTFQNPDFVNLAASFGIKGIRASTLGEFENILKEELQSLKEIVVIDVAMQN
ncbi:acetolactate synthase large subunit [Neobacillus drentensis]|uniref:acetolactate synthase large subunit n=1 Tax=Neobacillus drentensis TaxID=220684 RepID=UPI0030017FF2